MIYVQDELAETVTRMKAKLDQETAAQTELKMKINELNLQIQNLSSQVCTLKISCCVSMFIDSLGFDECGF